MALSSEFSNDFSTEFSNEFSDDWSMDEEKGVLKKEEEDFFSTNGITEDIEKSMTQQDLNFAQLDPLLMVPMPFPYVVNAIEPSSYFFFFFFLKKKQPFLKKLKLIDFIFFF